MEGETSLSLIVATKNRHDSLRETLRGLRDVAPRHALVEFIVVDDGSQPPLDATAPGCRVVRLESEGRSAARNAGARQAAGRVLLFVDDDIATQPGFIDAHIRSHAHYPDALHVGRVMLPREVLDTPFGRFRQALEDDALPGESGIVAAPNFCAAGNMSIARTRFLELGGFDSALSSGEDQEFALRHTAANGHIVFVADAVGVHRDRALDIRSYCRRVELGAEHGVGFVRKQPTWKDNQERARINGPLDAAAEPVGLTARKLMKRLFAWPVLIEALFRITTLLEHLVPGSSALRAMYRGLLGLHIARGYRRGLRGWASKRSA